MISVRSTLIVGVDDIVQAAYQGRMSPEQCRAARGFVDWSQSDLATAANVSLSTVRDFEKGRRVPIANNLAAMEAALASQGVRISTENDAQQVTYAKRSLDRLGPQE
jgi:DNA-binding transcriptional regulator YiaG